MDYPELDPAHERAWEMAGAVLFRAVALGIEWRLGMRRPVLDGIFELFAH